MRKQRRLAKAVSRKSKGSANRCKAIRRLARHHETAANRREHLIHQVSNRLVKTHDRICLEDLNTAGTLHNPKLARRIADAAWATLAYQPAYKQAWAGGQLVLADRWLPSSKTCSKCGTVKPLLDLRERTFHCAACGVVIDRDLNLAVWAENHAQAPERQADARATNVCREERSGRTDVGGETGLRDAENHDQAAITA